MSDLQVARPEVPSALVGHCRQKVIYDLLSSCGLWLSQPLQPGEGASKLPATPDREVVAGCPPAQQHVEPTITAPPAHLDPFHGSRPRQVDGPSGLTHPARRGQSGTRG